jgi:hypothetical protein
MILRRLLTAGFFCLLPVLAHAQSSYLAPDGKNRYPGVTIFCPSGSGVAPCNFAGGGGSSSSTVSVQTNGAAVSSGNRFPVSDSALDALVSGGALTIGGAVSLSGTPSVSLGAGNASIGSVSVSNLPATQPVSVAALPLPAGAATAAAQAASLGPVAPGTATATNTVVVGCVSNTTLPSFAAGQQGAVPCDSSGRPYVVTVPSSNNVPSYLQAVTSGGATIYRAINAAASTMSANVKTSGGMVYGYEACNAGSGSAYLRLFALATAPVVGTSTPTISKLLPAASCQGYSSTVGLTFSTGIGLDVTSGSLADSDTTAVATASQISVELYYK